MVGMNSGTDRQIRLLADDVNRAIVSVLTHVDGSLHVDELADRLVDREVIVVEPAEYEARREEYRLSLHHDRLPRLADAGLVQYDRETNVATTRNGDPPVPVSQDASVLEALEAHLPSGRGPDGDAVGRLEGRESIIEYGRQLADEATEELFCMYVSTDLLEDECVRRAQAALDRDVTMYVGSGNESVRELTRRHLPEATVWEPQRDWLNTPTLPRVGRLVLVDRRTVMLAVLQEPAVGGASHPGETALVGDGEEHPLVVLVRDLLGPRLDHLDFQSEEFRSELPS